MSRGKPRERGLGAFWKHEKWGLAWALFIAVSLQFLEFREILAGPEGLVLDLFLRVGSVLAPPNSPRIVSLEIDDNAFQMCFGTQPLDPEGVISLVRTAAANAEASVIGIDILTDPQSQDLAGKYSTAAAELMSSQPPIIWASGADQQKFHPVLFTSWLLGGKDRLVVRPTRVLGYDPGNPELKQGSWALAVFPRDEDLRLRRFPRTIDVSADPANSPVSEPLPNWAARIAEVYCKNHPGYHCGEDEKDEVFMSFDPDAIKPMPVLSVFQCQKAADGRPAAFSATDKTALKQFTDSTKDGVLLIGGTFRNGNDIHDTPKGPIPGIHINAYAILALIRGPHFSEVGRLWTFLPDVFLGFAIVYFFWRLSSVRSMILATVALLPFILIMSGVILYLGYVWLTCIGVAFGIMPHALLEIYKMNPALPKHRHS